MSSVAHGPPVLDHCFSHIITTQAFDFSVLFEDNIHADLIMRATDPREMKKLGRKVENFNPNVWWMESEKIVRVGIKAKVMTNDGNFRNRFHE